MTDTYELYLKNMASEFQMSIGPVRIPLLEGSPEKKNDILYHSPVCQPSSGSVIFFGGDMQDYKENMDAHRDNKFYSAWDLESTVLLLHNQFLTYDIILIKPVKMALKTFSCYENFVNVNNFGAPTYSDSTCSLKHLKLLILNLNSRQKETSVPVINDKHIILIGFSKGCVVLNQFLYSFHFLKSNPDAELDIFSQNIKEMYWLDGGHSGSSPTWVIDKKVLESFSQMNIVVQIHVTPYQVHCDTRPRIGKEEKVFRETLTRMGVDLKRKLHFECEPRSLEFHFKILTCFSDSC